MKTQNAKLFKVRDLTQMSRHFAVFAVRNPTEIPAQGHYGFELSLVKLDTYNFGHARSAAIRMSSERYAKTPNSRAYHTMREWLSR
ncbi:unnamed protein product [Macrosiphum euphorbiae]|uniref:Uncharacterized protein n=1 Tax=Macrosiphum euphorbiae TaxID=13131 RepID=A0AAV0W7P7_9HEMI|nr:unnamed protein product [Macrosiphum euphorbiae]